MSRANPTTDRHLLENASLSLLRLDVSQLITIGGDDTAFSAMKLLEEARGRLRIVHVPKTIDNDLDLPAYVDTFGFRPARHVGVEIVKNLMVDAKTTSRWYFVTAMGRKAGHLALGIGKAAGATLTLLPEEFSGRRIRLKTVVDTLAGAIIKRLSHGRRDGVAILAEGLVLSIDPADLSHVDEVEKDAHGHVRIDEVNISEILKAQVRARLKPFGLKATIVAKNIGYELRCADPIPSDMEYTRDLGYCAAKYLLSGGTGVMISMQAGNLVPIPFEKLVDPETGRTKVRMVDTHSTRYAIARRYMIRLRRDDFEDSHELAKFAATVGLNLDEFCREFQYLVERRAAGAGGEPGRSRGVALQPALVTALRTAGLADAGAITAVINAAYQVERFFIDGDRTSEDEVRRYMAKGAFLIAEEAGRPAGCVYTEQRGDRGYFGLLAVDPAQHGQGLGCDAGRGRGGALAPRGVPRGGHQRRGPAHRAAAFLPAPRVRRDGHRALSRSRESDPSLPLHPHVQAVERRSRR